VTSARVAPGRVELELVGASLVLTHVAHGFEGVHCRTSDDRIVLLRFLSEPELREQVTAVTNKTEAFHGFAAWLRFGGEAIGRNDPDYQEKIVKFNELLANCVIYGTACDITAVVNAFTADGHPVDPDDLATVVPYITHTVRRFGDWVLDLSAPQALPVTRLDLTPGALFSAQLTPPPGNPPARGVRECGGR